MTRGIIKHNMRENRDTESRPEQIKLQKSLIPIFWDCYISMEYPVYNPRGGKLVAKLDVAIVDKKIGYRINGESHDPYGDRDYEQKLELMDLGWHIYDINKWQHPELWG